MTSCVNIAFSVLGILDSAHSKNVRSASNMIPCFPANNSTDVHHIVSSRSSPSHSTKRYSFLKNNNIYSMYSLIFETGSVYLNTALLFIVYIVCFKTLILNQIQFQFQS
jgi:hypothetical protein